MSPRTPTYGRRFVATLGLLTGLSALTVDISLPAIPALVTALSTDLGTGQKIIGLFMAGMAFGQIPSGLLSDRLGRLPVLYGGMLIFAIAAIVAAAATDITTLLIARFVQGFGAASAIVLSRAIVRDISSGTESARLMSIMTMIFTAAPVIAPTVGALLIGVWGWRSPFVLIAVFGTLMIVAINRYLTETHQPEVGQNPVHQLAANFREFFSHRQSVFGLLLVILSPAGFMSVITISAALTVEIYGYSIKAYGLLFALAGLSILLGAVVNRWLVMRFDMLRTIAIGVGITAFCGLQLALIAWLDSAPFWWLWANVCLFMLTVAIIMPNATVIALDPMPRIAGVASSIIGTLQNLAGAAGALLAALIYDGSIRNCLVIIAAVALTTVAIFLLRPWLAPGPVMHHPDELARD